MKSEPQTSDYSVSIDDKYAEWDTYETIFAIRDALALNHKVTLVEADKNAYEKIRESKPDIVFNVAEGANGISREAQIPAILDLLEIPYTGSDPLTLATCLDKGRTKEILSYNKILTPKFNVINNPSEISKNTLTYPLFIKPLQEGSSKGIFNSSFVENEKDYQKIVLQALGKYNQPLIVEEYLPGREFTVALIGNGKETEVLPIIELNFSGLPGHLLPVYSYEAKWIFDSKDNPLDIYSCPAVIDSDLEKNIKDIALRTFHTLRCRDWCRIDIRMNAENQPNVIEVNPLPGVLPDPDDNSCFPKAARVAGMTYNEMINRVLNSALKRYNLL